MSTETNFSWISKLGEEECVQLMDLLELSRESIRGVVNLRIELYKEVPIKFNDAKFKEIIKATGAKITLNHDRLTMRRWIFELEENELKSYMQECNCLISGTLQELRKRFSRHIPNIPEQLHQAYLKKAREYIESLVYESLNTTDADLEDKLDDNKEPLAFGQRDVNDQIIVPHNPPNFNFVETEEPLVNQEVNIGLENLRMQNENPRAVRFSDSRNPLDLPREPPNAASTGRNISNMHSYSFAKSEMMDKARKWNVKYDGSKKPQDALLFLESLKEKAECYDIPLDLLPDVMPECLRGKAIEWYRNNKEMWTSWEHFEDSFRVFFAPTSMRIQQEFEVQRFHQSSQTIRDYALAMQSLMRHIPGYEEKRRQLDWIYHNLHPEYKNYIRPGDFRTLTELINLGEQFEQNQNELKRINIFKNNRRTNVIEDNSQIDRNNATCWNCDKIGHIKTSCTEPSRNMCYFCRTTGVTVEKCNCSRAVKMRKSRAAKRQRATAIDSKQIVNYAENQESCPDETYDNVCMTKPAMLSYLADPRPHQTVTLGDKDFKALLDTGATSSYINTNTAKYLESRGVKPRHTSTKTTLADGTTSSLTLIYWSEFFTDGLRLAHDFMRLDGMTSDVLFGVDILQILGYDLVRPCMIPRVNFTSSLVQREELSPEQEEILADFLDKEIENFKHLPLTSKIGQHVIKMKPNDEKGNE